MSPPGRPAPLPGGSGGPTWRFVAFVAGLLAVVVVGAVLALWPAPPAGGEMTEEEIAALVDSRTPELAAAVAAEATLWVDSEPAGAVVRMGREVVGVTPLRLHGLAPGFYALSVTGEAAPALDTLVYLGPGARLDVWHAPEALADAGAQIPLPERPRTERSGGRSPAPTRADARRRPPPAAPPAAAAVAPAPQATPPSTEPPPGAGALVVTSEPAGAQVLLNGRAVGRTPLRLPDLGAGAYHVVVQHAGYSPAAQTLEIEAGRSRTFWAALAPAQGSLLVVARPWGSIYVNGELRAQDTDLQHVLTLPVGTHRVRAVHPQLGAQERVVEVRADQTTRVVLDLNR